MSDIDDVWCALCGQDDDALYGIRCDAFCVCGHRVSLHLGKWHNNNRKCGASDCACKNFQYAEVRRPTGEVVTE